MQSKEYQLAIEAERVRRHQQLLDEIRARRRRVERAAETDLPADAPSVSTSHSDA